MIAKDVLAQAEFLRNECNFRGFKQHTPDTNCIRCNAANVLIELALILEQTCETCEFGHTPQMEIARWCEKFGSIPLVGANGQPFSCAGWRAKEAQS